MSEESDGIRGRVTAQGQEAIGKIAQDLMQNPIITGTVTVAFDARERAARAQELAMSALNLPSAADIERLTRRLRSVSQRIEGLEDGLDRLTERLETAQDAVSIDQRLAAIEESITRLDQKLG
jgi:predicted  nucleic acid-binding Zn-ribbon protein